MTKSFSNLKMTLTQSRNITVISFVLSICSNIEFNRWYSSEYVSYSISGNIFEALGRNTCNDFGPLVMARVKFRWLHFRGLSNNGMLDPVFSTDQWWHVATMSPLVNIRSLCSHLFHLSCCPAHLFPRKLLTFSLSFSSFSFLSSPSCVLYVFLLLISFLSLSLLCSSSPFCVQIRGATCAS